MSQKIKIGDYVRLTTAALEKKPPEDIRRSPGIVVGSIYSPGRYFTIKVQWLKDVLDLGEESWPAEMLEVIDETNGEQEQDEILASDVHD